MLSGFAVPELRGLVLAAIVLTAAVWMFLGVFEDDVEIEELVEHPSLNQLARHIAEHPVHKDRNA